MNEELVTALDEADYIQIGKLEAIYVKPKTCVNNCCDDVEIQVVRAIPNYPENMIPNELKKACTTYLRWIVKGRWDNLLAGGEALLSKCFARDSNSVLGASYLVNIPDGRKYSVSLKKDWDITVQLNQLPKLLRADLWYRFYQGHWSTLAWIEQSYSYSPGNIWNADDKVIIEEKYTRIGRWLPLNVN